MRVLADLAEAYGDGTMRLTVEQNVLYRWVKKESVEPFYQRLAAAGLGAPDAGTLERRRQLPRRGELPAGGDAVARPRPRADRAPERASGPGRPGPVGRHQDQRLPERLRPASHRRRSASRAACARWPAAPCRSTSCWSAAAARRRHRALRQGRVEGAGAPADRRASIGCWRSTSEQREGEEELGAFFRRVPPALATEALKDLAQLLPNEIARAGLRSTSARTRRSTPR